MEIVFLLQYNLYRKKYEKYNTIFCSLMTIVYFPVITSINFSTYTLSHVYMI